MYLAAAAFLSAEPDRTPDWSLNDPQPEAPSTRFFLFTFFHLKWSPSFRHILNLIALRTHSSDSPFLTTAGTITGRFAALWTAVSREAWWHGSQPEAVLFLTGTTLPV